MMISRMAIRVQMTGMMITAILPIPLVCLLTSISAGIVGVAFGDVGVSAMIRIYNKEMSC